MTGYQAKELTYFQHFVVDQEYLKTFSANDIKKMYNEYKQKKTRRLQYQRNRNN